MDKIIQTIEDFILEYCEYLPEKVPILMEPPGPVDFLTNYVTQSLPFLASHNSPPFEVRELWTKRYLCSCMEDRKVTVAVAPDGHADSALEDRCMLPEERSMDIKSFLNQFDYFNKHEFFYLPKENNNLIEEFSPLSEDAPKVEWATEAFGYKPDTANIWIGDQRSMTSMHMNHYECIYCVAKGTMTFELHPPVALAWMPYKKHKKYRWNMNVDKEWGSNDLKEEIVWIPNSRKPDTRRKFQWRIKTKSYLFTIYSGEVLYIPALWFHEVNQSDFCIAVKYNYDMRLDTKTVFSRLFRNLLELPFGYSDASVDKQTELEDSLLTDMSNELLEKKGLLGKKTTSK